MARVCGICRKGRCTCGMYCYGEYEADDAGDEPADEWDGGYQPAPRWRSTRRGGWSLVVLATLVGFWAGFLVAIVAAQSGVK
jgi:hypothetical protein